MSTIIPPSSISQSYCVRSDSAGDDLLGGGLLGRAVSHGCGATGDCVDLSCVDSQGSRWDTGVVLTALVEVLGNMLAGRGHGGEKAERCNSGELHFEIWMVEKGIKVSSKCLVSMFGMVVERRGLAGFSE